MENWNIERDFVYPIVVLRFECSKYVIATGRMSKVVTSLECTGLYRNGQGWPDIQCLHYRPLSCVFKLQTQVTRRDQHEGSPPLADVD
jgi:hypothetical protein